MEFKLNDQNIVRSLTSEEVKDLTSNNKVNRSLKKTSKGYLKIVIKNTINFFNLFLLAIAVVLIIFQKYTDTLFLLIAIMNSGIAIFQEIRAKTQIEKLRMISTKKVKVIRDDVEVEVDVTDVVLGDVIFVKSGDQIIGDGYLVEGHVSVNESFLTGETKPQLKSLGDSLLSGSYITNGYCYYKVDKVGDDTYMSKIESKAKVLKKNNSIIYNSFNKLIKILVCIILPLGILLLVGTYLQIVTSPELNTYSSWQIIVEKTAGSLIGMIPTGLILLTSVALAKGCISLVKKKTVVNNIYSIESLARVTTLCFDKTGTLTTNKISFADVIYFEECENILRNFILAFKDVNLTMEGLQRHFSTIEGEDLEVTEVINFSPIDKSSKVVINNMEYTLGAPDYILNLDEYPSIKSQIIKLSNEGYRVLLFKDKTKPLGLVLLEEELRPNIKSTISWFKDNNVKLKVISGDDVDTVKAIAKKVGIENYENAVSLKDKSLEETRKLALENVIFARVSPEQKEVICDELQKHDEFVGMTGDGINDIMALKQADCSIALGDGSQAAKLIADITLVNNDFESLSSVVYEGRRVINNIQTSSSLFLSRTFFSVCLTLIISILTFIPTIDINYPFSPKSLYLMSMFGIGVPSFFLALRPNSSLISGNYFKKILLGAIPGASGMLIVVLICITVNSFGLFNNGTVLSIEDTTTGHLYDGYITLMVLGMMLVSVTLIVLISIPMNRYLIILFVSILAVIVLYVFVPPYIFGDNNIMLLGIDFRHLNTEMWITFGVFAVTIPLYVVGTNYLFKRVATKLK